MSDPAIVLNTDELREITGRSRAPSQIAALRSLGIEYKQRADGRVIVSRQHALEVLSGGPAKLRRAQPEPGLNFAAIP